MSATDNRPAQTSWVMPARHQVLAMRVINAAVTCIEDNARLPEDRAEWFSKLQWNYSLTHGEASHDVLANALVRPVQLQLQLDMERNPERALPYTFDVRVAGALHDAGAATHNAEPVLLPHFALPSLFSYARSVVYQLTAMTPYGVFELPTLEIRLLDRDVLVQSVAQLSKAVGSGVTSPHVLAELQDKFERLADAYNVLRQDLDQETLNHWDSIAQLLATPPQD